jgi:hypothetical protein
VYSHGFHHGYHCLSGGLLSPSVQPSHAISSLGPEPRPDRNRRSHRAGRAQRTGSCTASEPAAGSEPWLPQQPTGLRQAKPSTGMV